MKQCADSNRCTSRVSAMGTRNIFGGVDVVGVFLD